MPPVVKQQVPVAAAIPVIPTAPVSRPSHIVQKTGQVHAKATAMAEPVWERIAACARKVRQEAVAGLTQEQVEQLLATLKIVHGNLAQRGCHTAENLKIED